MYKQILSRIRTYEEAQKLIEEIELINEAIFSKESSEVEVVLKSRVRLWVADALREDWKDGNVQKEEYLRDLKSRLENLKVLDLVLAFEPTDTSIDKFFNFVTENLGEGVVLNITLDKSILGGAKIIWEGRYRDFTLLRVFDEEFRSRKEEIISLLSESGNTSKSS